MFKGRAAVVLVVVLVLCLGLAFPHWASTAADDAPKPATPAGDFNGKVLAINTDAADKTYAWAVLEQVQVRTVGGATFLVGKGVDDGREGNPYKGRTLWIGVTHVVQMVEFASPEDLKKSYKPEQP